MFTYVYTNRALLAKTILKLGLLADLFQYIL